MGTIPFQQGEFRMMQRPQIPIPKDMGEGENTLLASGQKLFAGHFG
jgi:hypothetical protein